MLNAIVWVLYKTVQYITWFFFKLLFRLECVGIENLPATGPLLLVSNHASNLDPFLIGIPAYTTRELHFLAKQELFGNKFTRKIFTLLFAHPIKRGQVDRQALKTISELLTQQKAILIFPEGTRTKDGQLQSGKAGVGLMIYQAKVPVLPVYIANSFKALPRKQALPSPVKIKVYFGKSQNWADLWDTPASKEIYQQLSDRCLEEIGKLKPQNP